MGKPIGVADYQLIVPKEKLRQPHEGVELQARRADGLRHVRQDRWHREASCPRLEVVPPSFPYSQKEDGATEGQLCRHGNPHAPQAEALRQPPSQGEAHAPHGEKTHGGGLQGVACGHADRIAHYCRGEERLCKGFYAQHLGAETPYLVYRREEAYHLWREDKHDHAHESHHYHARGNGEMGEVVAQSATARAIGLANERGGGIAHAVARHIAKALGGDGKRVGGYGGIA